MMPLKLSSSTQAALGSPATRWWTHYTNIPWSRYR